MAGGCDKVQKHVNSVVTESRVTLDTRLLRKNIIVLSLEIADNLAEASTVSHR